MSSPLFVVFSVVVSFATWLIFLRFIFQLAGIERKQSYGLAIYRLSAVVDVFARIFPNLGQGRVSLSALVLLWLLNLIEVAGKAAIMAETVPALVLFFVGTMFAIVNFLSALKWTILAAVLASFSMLFTQNPHPIVEMVMRLSEPLVAPFRKISPSLGMMDLAPLFAMLGYGLMSTLVGIIATHIVRTHF